MNCDRLGASRGTTESVKAIITVNRRRGIQPPRQRRLVNDTATVVHTGEVRAFPDREVHDASPTEHCRRATVSTPVKFSGSTSVTTGITAWASALQPCFPVHVCGIIPTHETTHLESSTGNHHDPTPPPRRRRHLPQPRPRIQGRVRLPPQRDVPRRRTKSSASTASGRPSTPPTAPSTSRGRPTAAGRGRRRAASGTWRTTTARTATPHRIPSGFVTARSCSMPFGLTTPTFDPSSTPTPAESASPKRSFCSPMTTGAHGLLPGSWTCRSIASPTRLHPSSS